MSRNVRIAAIAVATIDGLLDANYRRAIRITEIALEMKPDLVLLPEAFAAGYPGGDLAALAETPDSRYLAEFRDLSRRSGVLIALGYLERDGHGIRNAVVIYDAGRTVGCHYKSKLWPDRERPYRDEVSLMVPGDGVEVFDTRFGGMAILICYESGFPELWAGLAGKADFALTPYNCEQDPIPGAVLKEYRTEARIPSAWADRVGMTWAGGRYRPNLGTAGLVDARGNIIASSAPGVEDISIASLEVGSR
jgi:NAD+ synthase (glutamine-hydrolysing)